MENTQYLQAFLDESAENILVLNQLCLQIEQGQRTDREFAAMFRAAHTLKGMSATMGFVQMTQLTHRLEDVLGSMRADPAKVSLEAIETFFFVIDTLDAMLSRIRLTGSASDINCQSALERLELIVQTESREEVAAAGDGACTPVEVMRAIQYTDDSLQSVLDACRDQGTLTGVLEVDVDHASIMKGPRAILIGRVVEDYADCLYSEPSADEMEAGVYGARLRFVIALRGSEEQPLIDAVQNVAEVTSVHFMALTQTQVQSGAPELTSPRNQESSLPTGSNEQSPHKSERLERTIRVPVERLDTLMNLLSELVVDKTRLLSLATQMDQPELKEVVDHVSRLSNELQSTVMSLRMTPVDSVFQRFPRMLRDLSKSLEKDIKLEMSGLDTEFDRTVLDEMSEALVHLIRNAADHGLESAEVRTQAGKPPEGTMKLNAYAAGQHVFIEVSDDGRGIDTEKVVLRAVENGLMDRLQGASLSNEQIYALLFESGFSTADKLSEVSGRGVGLDAVRKKVETLGGAIQIESQPGRGTTFRVRLPITLSILQALLVQIRDQVYAIPLGNVEEVVLAGEQVVEHVHAQKFLKFRDKIVPILHGNQWLFDDSTVPDYPWKLVVCQQGARRVAIRVDRLSGQQEIVHKSLGNYLRRSRLFSGAAILGDGTISLILDVNECFVHD